MASAAMKPTLLPVVLVFGSGISQTRNDEHRPAPRPGIGEKLLLGFFAALFAFRVLGRGSSSARVSAASVSSTPSSSAAVRTAGAAIVAIVKSRSVIRRGNALGQGDRRNVDGVADLQARQINLERFGNVVGGTGALDRIPDDVENAANA